MPKRALAAAVLAATILVAPPDARAAQPPARRVIVVLLDRVTVQELARIPAARGLARRGAVGLLSAGGRGVVSSLAGSMTFSAGDRALPPDPAVFPFTFPGGPVNETFAATGTLGQAYQARTTLTPPPVSRPDLPPVVYPDDALVDRLNRRADVRATPGLLGQTLHDHGIATAAISIRGSAASRLAPVVAMDEEGTVPYGALTDLRDFRTTLDRALSVARFVAVDGGDALTARSILPQVIGRTTPLDALLVLSPDPPQSVTDRHTWLAPILAAGPGLPRGLLTSASTRRRGVVSNVDLAPQVLAWLQVGRPPEMLGHAFRVDRDPNGLGVTEDLFATYERVAAQRGEVFRTAAVTGILALIAGALVAFRGRRREDVPTEGGSVRLARALLLGVATIPLAMLLEPFVGSARLRVTLLVVIGGSFLVGAILSATVRRTSLAFALVGAAIVAVLAVDVVAGNPLGTRSLLGFTVAGGTRFFGLGSEEMGALLAGLLLLLGFVVDRQPRRRWALYSGALLLVLLFALPQFGAKFGMVLTAIPALVVAWTRFERRRVTVRLLLAAAGVVAVVGVLVVLVGVALGARGSHIGTETRAIGAQGFGAALSVFLRRAGVALRLLGTTFWAWLVAAGLGVWLFVAAARRDRFRRLAARRPGFAGAAAGLAVAGLAALLFNDAGAVIVATMVLVGAPAILADVVSEDVEAPPAEERGTV